MKHAELGVALVWLGASLYIARNGWTLGLGKPQEPGTGAMVFWTGLLMAVLALAVAAQAVFAHAPDGSDDRRWDLRSAGRAFAVVACLAVYVWVLDRAGFLLSTVTLMLVLMRGIDPVPWRLALPIAIGTTGGLWWLLKRVLLIQLPSGTFEIG